LAEKLRALTEITSGHRAALVVSVGHRRFPAPRSTGWLTGAGGWQVNPACDCMTWFTPRQNTGNIDDVWGRTERGVLSLATEGESSPMRPIAPTVVASFLAACAEGGGVATVDATVSDARFDRTGSEPQVGDEPPQEFGPWPGMLRAGIAHGALV